MNFCHHTSEYSNKSNDKMTVNLPSIVYSLCCLALTDADLQETVQYGITQPLSPS